MILSSTVEESAGLIIILILILIHIHFHNLIHNLIHILVLIHINLIHIHIHIHILIQSYSYSGGQAVRESVVQVSGGTTCLMTTVSVTRALRRPGSR